MQSVPDYQNGQQAGRVERPSWLDVDLDAVADNAKAVQAAVGARTQVCAVVKADAYGLGAAAVARAALVGGASYLAVARVEEGVALRRRGFTCPILLIAGFVPAEAPVIVRWKLTPTLVQVDDALALARSAFRAGVSLPVHLKVDTGLTRFGAAPGEAILLAQLVETLGSLRIEGLYTHLASADDRDLTFARAQLARFRQIVADLRATGIAPPLVHAANTAGALALPDARFDLVRVGLALTGHYPSADVPRAASLRPAVSLAAQLLRVYDVPAGTTIGYGCTYTTEQALRVGLVPVGYADGVPRANAARAAALVGGRRVPLVGRVSMDQCVVDLSDVPDAQAGDLAVLFGRAGADEIGLDEFASWSDTISHEALCRIGPRVPRRYCRGGKHWWSAEAIADQSSERREPLSRPRARTNPLEIHAL